MNWKFWKSEIYNKRLDPIGSPRPFFLSFCSIIIVLAVNFLIFLFYKPIVQKVNNALGENITNLPISLDFDTAVKISVGVFAVFTLWVAITRSIINVMQVEEQRKQGLRTEKQLDYTAQQITNTNKQIEQTEIKNLTELLAKGTEFIQDSPDNTNEKKLVGVSILYQVALENKDLFGKVVEQLFINYIIGRDFVAHKKCTFQTTKTIDNDTPPYVWEAIKSLHNMLEQAEDILCSNNIKITQQTNVYFQKIKYIYYESCEFNNISINSITNKFEKCRFIYCDVDVINIINNTMIFMNCKISNIKVDYLVTPDKFKRIIFDCCDFTKYSGNVDCFNSEFINCFYVGDVNIPDELKRKLTRYEPNDDYPLTGPKKDIQ